MRAVVTSIRHRYQSSIENRTERLDPNVRVALANDIHNETNCAELQEIESQLLEAREKMSQFEQSEAFVSQRIHCYRRQLDDRESQLKKEHQRRSQGKKDTVNDDSSETENLTKKDANTAGNTDTEAGIADLEKGFDRLRIENKALAEVMDRQKGVIANIESMRRQVKELERKRNDILRKREENKVFLLASAIADEIDTEEFIESEPVPEVFEEELHIPGVQEDNDTPDFDEHPKIP